MTTSRRTTDEWIKSRQDMTFVERLSDIQETDRDIKVGELCSQTWAVSHSVRLK